MTSIGLRSGFKYSPLQLIMGCGKAVYSLVRLFGSGLAWKYSHHRETPSVSSPQNSFELLEKWPLEFRVEQHAPFALFLRHPIGRMQ